MKNYQLTSDINKMIFRYSFYATLTYIGYFIIMRLFGLAPHIELRFVNYFLYFIIGYNALHALTVKKNGNVNYLQGLGISYVIGVLSFIFYAVFVFLYSFFDSFFTITLLSQYPSANVMGRFGPSFVVAAEGIGLCSIVSFCLMQYFKIYSRRSGRFLLFRKKDTVPG